ncbi:MAG TPA: PQQ-binding-like beta-propeller repeat protein [Pirellulaceae bacterium]|nr:PQQ-binding-like beta-propeller repeat protein [Pirellulaceae bacterium]
MTVFRFAASLLLLQLAAVAALSAQERGIAEFPKLSAERDWPWWRGPTRNGIASQAAVPTKFGPASAVWKAPVPGRGHSSPIVVGDRVYLTTADMQVKSQSVLAFDRRSGKQVWQVEISRGGFPARNHPKNTEATPTIASDGERLFVTFFHHEQIQATALDLGGKQLWQKTAGPFNPKKYEYGYAPSPLVYRGSVIIAAEYDGKSFLLALARESGRELWRTPRPFNISFSSPVVGHVAGRDQLLISGADHVTSYNPATGKQLWTAAGTTQATCGTLVWEGDTVIASGGYPKSQTLAIKADGSGRVLWENNQNCYEQSLLAAGGYAYALTGRGILYCWRISDGQEMWKERLQGPVSASPVLAGGHIYWANELGTLYVFRPSPEKCQLVAENQIGDDAFPSPAICGGQLFLRVGHKTPTGRQEILYCFGSRAE